MGLRTALLCCLLAFTDASNNVEPFVLHRRDDHAPIGQWTRVSDAPQDSIIPIRIAIAPRNIHNGHGHKALMDISSPTSQNFGNHWTAQDIYDVFAPDPEAITNIQDWLSRSGIPRARQKLSSSLGSIRLDVNVREAEQLLHAKYDLWKHSSGAQALSCDEYQVPKALNHRIDFITPTTGFHAARVRSNALPLLQSVSSNCSVHVTPECIRELYGFPIGNETQPGNDFGLFQSEEGYDQTDLNSLFKNLAPFIPQGTHPIAQDIDGGKAIASVKKAGDEAMLDLNVAYPVVYPQQIRYFETYSNVTKHYNGVFDDFLDAIDPSFCTSPGSNNTIDPHFPNKYWNGSTECGIYKPPNVLSSSYYNGGPFYYPAAYQKRQCNEYLKLGLQGVSIFFASGDSGNIPWNGCGNDSTPGLLFPSDCPYITSVGATKISSNTSVGEEAAYAAGGAYTSGGGFSAVFPRPDYQTKAVEHYLKTNKNLPTRNLGNVSHRAFPDVSAVGQNFVIWSNGKKQSGDGTSAATPLFAGIITRINGKRLAAGKKPLGFLNPILYSHPEMLNDVVEGYNTGCPKPGSYKPTPSFYCQAGWDPVTGLGTPNFPKMVKYLLNLK